MDDDKNFLWTAAWIRSDAVVIFFAALWAVPVTHGSWPWFVGLFLLPDLSMAGYWFGNRAGAVAYNTGHMFAWPVALLLIGIANHQPLTTTAAASWIAHIAFDHIVGYGLKLPTSFEQTTLGPIGRPRIAAQRR